MGRAEKDSKQLIQIFAVEYLSAIQVKKTTIHPYKYTFQSISIAFLSILMLLILEFFPLTSIMYGKIGST